MNRRFSYRGFKVAIDVDDVMIPCHARYCEVASSLLGYEVDPWTSPYDLGGMYGEELNKQIWAIIDSQPGWCAPPIPEETKTALMRLRGIADELVAVTSPHSAGSWMSDRQKWLINEAGFAKDDVIQTSGKYHVDSDVLIDDIFTNLQKWRTRHPHGTAILMTAPHNAGKGDGYMTKRADSWDDVVKHVIRAKMVWRRDNEALDYA